MRLGIVVPTYNNFMGLADMLESVRSKTPWTPYIVPNWRENLGCAKGWNLGCKRAIEEGCTHLLIVNDDILFAPYTIDNLMKHLNKHDCVMVTASNIAGQLENPHDIFNFPEPTEENLSPHPDFSCMLVKPDIFDKIGWFDENFERAYFEDNDYHYRIELAGLLAENTTKAPYYHIGSVTQNSQPGGVVPGEIFTKNHNYFMSKWGDVPGRATFKHPFNDVNKSWKDW